MSAPATLYCSVCNTHTHMLLGGAGSGHARAILVLLNKALTF